MSLSAKAKQQIMRMETYAKFPYLIEVSHEDYGTLRFANCDKDIVYNGETYVASFFSVNPPDRTNSGITDGTLTISAIDQVWINRIRNTQKRTKLKFLACIVYDEQNQIEGIETIEELDFVLTKCQWNDTVIQWTMVFDEDMDLVIPCDVASPQKTPGIA